MAALLGIYFPLVFMELKSYLLVAVVSYYVWGSEGLASIVNQRWSRQMQEIAMISLGNLSEVTMDLK